MTSSKQVSFDLTEDARKLRAHARTPAIGVARIVSVDYCAGEATLQALSGEDDLFQHTSVPITQPSAGARHFLGALPEPGDICIFSFLRSGSPVILGYLPIAQKAGVEWLISQDTLPSEIDFSPKLQDAYEGIYSRRRFKAWPISPGNILLSSSQGSDLRLDEGITLQSRKLSEIRLRDADTSILLRSQFIHASLCGVSQTSGIPQRSALLLPSRLQTSNSYTPHPVFQKTNPSSPFPDSGIEVDANLDPYSLSPLVGVDGSINALPSLEYANIPISPVPSGSQYFTEHRLELSHLTNPSLPSSQLIDGFSSPQTPYLELVYGTVIPNDPNDPLYGSPVELSLTSPTPSFVPSSIGDATLFRLSPPDNSSPPTIVSFSKTGMLKAFLSGPQDGESLSLSCRGSISISSPSISLNTPSLSLPSLSSSRDTTSISSSSVSLSSTSTTLQSQGPTLITAQDSISIQDANTVSVSPKQTLRLISDKLVAQANTIDRTVQGKETTVYVGPKSSLPSNGPTREVTFASTPATGNLGGTVDKYKVVFGDREETFTKGNHSTSIVVGDLTYKTGVGTFKASAGPSSLSISSSSGLSSNATAISLSSTTNASLQGNSSLTLKSSGLSKLSGSVVILSAPGNSGLILCSSDKEPFTDLPFSFYGLGSPGHLLSTI